MVRDDVEMIAFRDEARESSPEDDSAEARSVGGLGDFPSDPE